jgi:antitoxin component of MazEF toxin-antitoxin module
MKATTHKWGNSLAIRVPKRIAEEAGLREKDAVEGIGSDTFINGYATRSRSFSITGRMRGLTADSVTRSTLVPMSCSKYVFKSM